MSDVLIAQEVGSVVAIETIPAEVVEVVSVGPQGPVGDVNPQMPVILSATEAARDAAQVARTGAETAASASAASAAASANSESVATTKAGQASGSSDSAAASATGASGSATAALGSANSAATSATNAANSATAAQSAQTATESARDTTLATISSVVLKANNLSDLANAAAARTNIGLGNVDNTSDANKPVSTAQLAALNTKESASNKGVANGYAGLDATGKVPAAQLPSYVDSVAGKTGVVTLVKADVGLGNVDNTSDASKPVSNAQQTALDLKANAASPTTTGTLTHSGDITLSGSGKRLTGDFSNTTAANRVLFQTSTANSGSNVGAIANGTVADNTGTGFIAWGNSDTTSSQAASMYCFKNLEVRMTSGSNTGTYLPMTFYTGGSERMRIDSAGNVGIGTSTPSSYGKLAVLDNSTGQVAAMVTNGNATLGASTCFYVNQFGGPNARLLSSTYGSADVGTITNHPLTITTNSIERMRIDTSGNVGIGGSNTSGMRLDLKQGSYASNQDLGLTIGTPSGANGFLAGVKLKSDGVGVPRLAFDYPTGATFGLAEGLKIDSSGAVLAVGAGGGLGYGTGAGGTVTQATSKSTAVTLNKPTGQITMNNAALAAGAQVQFTFNNSLVSAADAIILNLSGGLGTGSSYTVRAFPVAGIVYIVLKNDSAGSLSDAVQINFAIIKGATA